jgi:Rad3-related DNA helicase
VLEEFSSAILFSATIGDVEIFKKNLGIEDAQFYSSSQFNTENLKVILKRDISSIYTQRKETAKKVESDIRFLQKMSDSVLLAFPSYAASYDVLAHLNEAQDLDAVKECDRGLYYVILGGKGSRGINKAHNLSIVYIYGLQIPQKDDYFFNKRRDYLMKRYPQEEAYKILYANVVSKACQVAGRIFRTRNKKGLVIFADSRYKYDFMQKDFFYKSFPLYFKNKMVETLNEHEFKMHVGNFWGKLF